MKRPFLSIFWLAVLTICCSSFVACDSGSSSTGGYDFDVVNDSSSSAQ
ncbi:MAG: hypothetical protein MJY78_05715 [Fibrobacter sp.]|nr:hypothetical protein [Fibrobacter sp.]